MTKNWLTSLALTFLGALFCTSASAEAIEHRGDRYVIHVDQLDLDGDESLMDILMMCPEIVSLSGRDALSEYAIRIDNVGIGIDRESFLYHTKARELGTIQICTNTVASKGTGGVNGVIDVRYRDIAAQSKVAAQGSTYGSARVYTDMVRRDRDKHLTLSATAIGNTRYVKFNEDNIYMTNRSAIEDLRLSAKWRITNRDSLQINLVQGFNDSKARMYQPTAVTTSDLNRNINFTTTYARTLNDKDADLYVEVNYTHNNHSQYLTAEYNYSAPQDKLNSTYLLVESNIPMFSHKAWLLVGTENGYDNTWNVGNRRNQFMYNDFYVQFDYKHGGWLFTLGDRYRILTYWQRYYNAGTSDLWRHSRNHHGYVGSVGYTFNNKHTIQGTFAHRYYNPDIEEFSVIDRQNMSVSYNTDIYRKLAYVSELKYTYQGKDLVIMGGVNNSNFVEMEKSNYSLLTVKASAMWHKGIMRLTLGAAFCHRHDRGDNGLDMANTNYYQLKCIPSVSITPRTRFTATVLYNSNRLVQTTTPSLYTEYTPNLYASARLSHFFNTHLNVYADYQNIAGQRTGNRALIIGAQYTL